MKTKHWILFFLVLAAVCVTTSLPLLSQQEASFAEIRSDGELVATVSLSIDRELTIAGHNTVTVKDGKIAVTWADCPDHYCMDRGFCSGGTDIVCLPNRLVISFVGEQSIDGVSG